MPSKDRNPQFLGVVIVGMFFCVGAVISAVETGTIWALIAAFAVLVVATFVVVRDVEWTVGDSDRPRRRPHQPLASSELNWPEPPGPNYTGPEAPHRLVVMTSEPVSAEQVLDAVSRCNGVAANADSLGVMVVSPEGFGESGPADDEGRYRSALRAESETVASLRSRPVKAAGYVGDHDGAQALEDALVLFPAEHVLVFAHPHYATAYRHAVMRTNTGVPVDIIDMTS